MNTTPARAPGLYYEAVPPATDPSPLRSDVAGFIGPTRRGLPGAAVRVEGWRQYLRWFGPLAVGYYTPYAIKGYFDNGGQVAYVVRVAGPCAQTARATWTVGSFDAGTQTWRTGTAASAGFGATAYTVWATSAGAWANDARITCLYRRRGLLGRAEVDMTIDVVGEPPQRLTGVDPAILIETVAAQTGLIRLEAAGPPPPPLDGARPGPAEVEWTLRFAGGDDGFDIAGLGDEAALRAQYLQTEFDAAGELGDQPEVALVALPDLHRDPLLDDAAREQLVEALLNRAAELHDRLVVLGAPSGDLSVSELLAFADGYRLLADDVADPTRARCAALYHPWLTIADPLATREPRLLDVPPVGHVAGVISRLDRERGAHHTPANAPILEAWDVTARIENDQAVLNPAGINLLRCVPGAGLEVWGGRTLHVDGQALAGLPPAATIDGRFIAHRRLVHRLVRAIRRVAEPLVFDVNGPELWLALVRAITSVLLEAFRAGALKGDRPEDAFRVQCDDKTNPPEEQDAGRCTCVVQLAPAKPMEFILLRVALMANGALEVAE